MRRDAYTSPTIETLQGQEILERFGPVAGGSAFDASTSSGTPKPGGFTLGHRR